MIGFFEHQYLSFKKNHLKNLIALAKVDGHLHEAEEHLLYKIGGQYGLKERQIKSLIEVDQNDELQIPESHQQKMNQLYDLVTMVYADGVIDKSEVEFCEHLVEEFGYKKEIVSWIIGLFEKGGAPHPDDWKTIIKEAEEKFTFALK